jgi:hypothetical protein
LKFCFNGEGCGCLSKQNDGDEVIWVDYLNLNFPLNTHNGDREEKFPNKSKYT